MTPVDPVPAYPEGAIDVASPEALASAVAALAAAAEIAVDVEADAMHAFRARLCFVQLGTDSQIYLLDTLVPGVRAEALADLFADPARTKFFHAAGGDLQYLAEAGVRVRGLFDTQRAATLLGIEKIGLADVVRAELGIELPKEHQKSDFALRPLDPAVRAYIADDVRYLCEVGRRLIAACRAKDILEETLLDCERLSDEAAVRPEPGDGAPKVSSRGLSPESWRLSQAIARELHRLRVEWGEAHDMPVGRILSKAAILDLAMLRPTDLGPVVSKGNLQRSFVRNYGRETLAAIRRVEEMAAKGTLPDEVAPATEPDPLRRKRDDALRAFRNAQAATRGVTPSVVLPNPLIGDLLAAPPTSLDDLARMPYFGAKRLALYGQAILELMRGVS